MEMRIAFLVEQGARCLIDIIIEYGGVRQIYSCAAESCIPAGKRSGNVEEIVVWKRDCRQVSPPGRDMIRRSKELKLYKISFPSG